MLLGILDDSYCSIQHNKLMAFSVLWWPGRQWSHYITQLHNGFTTWQIDGRVLLLGRCHNWDTSNKTVFRHSLPNNLVWCTNCTGTVGVGEVSARGCVGMYVYVCMYVCTCMHCPRQAIEGGRLQCEVSCQGVPKRSASLLCQCFVDASLMVENAVSC